MKKFSKDPKVKVVELEQFLNDCKYYPIYHYKQFKTIPEANKTYYKITDKLFISVHYCKKMINFGTEESCGLDEIHVAFRDGDTEYKLFQNRIAYIRALQSKNPGNRKINEALYAVNRIYNSLPMYNPLEKVKPHVDFEKCLSNIGYKVSNVNLKNKAVVIDVETNGVRKSNDDLLSLSIYDPTTGICYNRYFPLHMQPLVINSYIHGITDEDLVNATDWTQEEIDQIIDFFDLKRRHILSYSGGKGSFDRDVIINYCKRNKLKGFEDLSYVNIKSYLPKAPWGCEGELTKDNMCNLLNIEGVNEIHTSSNDCLLEWKLFEKLVSNRLFFINNNLYKFNKNYIIPITYLDKYPELQRFANITVPYIKGTINEEYSFKVPRKIRRVVKKFPTNITGMSLEEALRFLLDAKEQDNHEFLIQNKQNLEYIGTLKTHMHEIPVTAGEGGKFISLEEENDDFVDLVNSVTEMFKAALCPIAFFIKESILSDEEIMSQELVISDDKKVLCLCDFSTSKAILEMKTYNFIEEDGSIRESLAKQLYYQSAGRKTYALSIDFKTHVNWRNITVIDDIIISIFDIKLEIAERPKVKRILADYEVRTLKAIIQNPHITFKALKEEVPYGSREAVEVLKKLGYIKKESDSRTAPWIILRKPSDNVTYIG